jgi:hypothetical protein
VAMHLLQSNVYLNMIRSWLGHASIETTNTYVEIDFEMKRKTLQSCEKRKAWSFMAAQERHPVMVVCTLVKWSGKMWAAGLQTRVSTKGRI